MRYKKGYQPMSLEAFMEACPTCKNLDSDLCDECIKEINSGYEPRDAKTYKAMYRCRLCGKAFYSGSEKDEQTARGCMNIMITGLNPKYIATPNMLYKHDCGEPYNGVGLADFIGYIAKEDDTNAEETN